MAPVSPFPTRRRRRRRGRVERRPSGRRTHTTQEEAMASQTPNDQTAAINAEVAAALSNRSNPFQLRFDKSVVLGDLLDHYYLKVC